MGSLEKLNAANQERADFLSSVMFKNCTFPVLVPLKDVAFYDNQYANQEGGPVALEHSDLFRIVEVLPHIRRDSQKEDAFKDYAVSDATWAETHKQLNSLPFVSLATGAVQRSDRTTNQDLNLILRDL